MAVKSDIEIAQEAKMLHGQVQKGQPLLTPQKGDRSQCRDSNSAVRQ